VTDKPTDPGNATESQAAELHGEFCKFLLEKLREKDPATQLPTISASWGTVIRSFLNDNDIKTVPDVPGTPLGNLADEWRGKRPPRGGFDPDVDGALQ
jgi:hypothetical protein